MWTSLLPQPGIRLGHANAVPGWNSRGSEAGSEIDLAKGRYRVSSGFLFGRQISLGKRRQTFLMWSKSVSSLSLKAFKKRLGRAR
uniref:Uncharacterized protein n=1 Tax=Cercocebus atys TaxID=9531 RepID=A0A2K5M6L1_CERAT